MAIEATKTLYRRVRRQAEAVQRRLFCRIAPQQLESVLGQLLRGRPELLLVHSSLSRCGHLVVGAEGLLRSLRGTCATLCLPTHTYCYTFQGATETFDPRRTPSRNGRLTNIFWMTPDVSRSIHPTHSLAAVGPRAVELCQGHLTCTTACGEGTPYEKLVLWDAAVLMFGTTMNTYTLFHYAEHVAKCSYLYEPKPYDLRARDHEGHVHAVKLWRQDMTVPRRFTEMREELAAAQLLRSQQLGRGELLFIPSARAVHEYTMGKLKNDEFHLVDRRQWNTRPQGAGQHDTS